MALRKVAYWCVSPSLFVSLRFRYNTSQMELSNPTLDWGVSILCSPTCTYWPNGWYSTMTECGLTNYSWALGRMRPCKKCFKTQVTGIEVPHGISLKLWALWVILSMCQNSFWDAMPRTLWWGRQWGHCKGIPKHHQVFLLHGGSQT